MTILSAATWPLLQDLQETKHKSGLFSCTATYIRPAGDTSLPTQIETSIGPVDVWPDPSVNKDTSGFDRITATGYAAWDNSLSEIVYGYNLHTFGAGVDIENRCTTPDRWELVDGTYEFAQGCSTTRCGQIKSVGRVTTTGTEVFLQACVIKKIGDELPPPPALKYYDTAMNELTEITAGFVGLPTWQEAAGYSGEFAKTDVFYVRTAYVRKNVYGSVIETEVGYELSGPTGILFDKWTEPEVDPSSCDPGPRPDNPEP